MADKMDIDAVAADKQEEKVGPAPELPAERSTLSCLNELPRITADLSTPSSCHEQLLPAQRCR